MNQYKKDYIMSIAQHYLIRELIPSKEVAQFIGCQFALESEFGSSKLAVIYNNHCGMKKPYRRYTCCISNIDEKGFASYQTLTDCVKDYLYWLFYNRPYQNQLSELEGFIIFLQNSGYCPEKGYIDKIQTLYNQFFTNN